MMSKSLVFKEKILTKRSLMFGFALFILPLTAQIKIFLPNTPVPIVLQNVIILSISALLGKRMGPLLALSYIMLGFLGLPVFSKASSGLGLLSSPTSGYLLGYLVASYIMGKWFEQKEIQKNYLSRFVAFFISTITIDLFGFVFLSFFISPKEAFTLGILPFLFVDLVKISIAALWVTQTIRTE